MPVLLGLYPKRGDNNMEKYTQGQIRTLINAGVAADITRAKQITVVPHIYTQVGYSAGIYGINGAVLRDDVTGQLYAIVGRTTALFLFC